ncbi:NUDIX hydrolase [Marinicellulosiphila megalodicopiae]|uniref:NUDIX hydrolase n=1 Tax=Marinicellulosiphila megalodicopiae TaxID=2724896 RepID=UPI003BB13B24
MSDLRSNLPHLTVASIVHNDGKFLLVEEHKFGKSVYNQPAGHVEGNETLIEACIRETVEETGYLIRPTALLGFYRYFAKNNQTHYLRCTIIGELLEQKSDQLDPDIMAIHWLDLDQIKTLEQQNTLRSPLVLQNIEDYLAGRSFDIKALDEPIRN